VRIAIDGRYAQDHFPGIGRYIYSLGRSLALLDADLDLLVLYDPNVPATWLSMADLAGLPGVELRPVGVGVFSPISQIAISRVLTKEHIDVYHSPYYIRPYLLSVPAVVTLHDIIPILWPDSGTSGWAQVAFRLATRLSVSTAKQIIVGSTSAKDDFIRYFKIPPQRIHVVHHGADARFRPFDKEQDQEGIATIRRRYSLDRDYILYVGINKPHKNLVTLIDAFHRMGRTDLQLVFAGAEDHRYPATRQAVAQFGLEDRVAFLGAVPDTDLPWLYSEAAVFAFPSLYEGFGLPVVEAMACGAPVVCSSASSLPEVVGDAGILVDPGDPVAWAREIARVVDDGMLRQDLRRRSLSRAAEFSWKKAAEATLDVYREAIKQ
jgi:alpha-1,3-rhamnosyl/mannosyltransferase